MWAYTGTSAPTYQLRFLGYAESKETCELMRAADLYGTTKEHPYLGATFSETCRPALVGGAGAEYWAFAVPPRYARGQAFGTKTQCESIRATAGPASVATGCAPVSVRFLDQKGAMK